MSEIINTPSVITLDRTPAKVIKFLNAYGTNRTIRNVLIQQGFTATEQQRGWTLLKAASGGESTSDSPPTPEELEVRNAGVTIDQWDEPNFAKIKAILAYDFPDTTAYLFRGGLVAKQGPEALLSVGTLCERIHELEQASAPERANKRAVDQAALEKLAKRGYTKQEWERLRTLVATASKSLPAIEEETNSSEEESNFQKAMLELYAWWKEWSTIARSAVKKKSQLISLGLAKRKSSKADEEEEIDEEATD
jgi:hypothetical protein